MEYKPNSLFAFIKNERSFHGVEAISDANVQRDVLLYDIRVLESKLEPPTSTAGNGVKLLQRLFGSKK